ncbi:SpoIIE family protein phosphatase [Oscillospiraceae bacterium WX1]
MTGNDLRQRLSAIKTDLQGGAALKVFKADKALAAECLIRFALAFVLSGSQIFGAVAPFAVGLTAASGAGVTGFAALFGAIVGYLLSGSFFWAVKYISIAVIVTTAAIVFRDTEVKQTDWFMPVIAAVVTACIGFVSAADAGWTAAATALFVTDIVLAGGSAYFYKIALSPWSGRFNLEQGAEITHTVSILILMSTLLISLAHLELFGVISIGRAAATLIVFLAAFKGGAGMGCATGLAVGLAMDASTSVSPIFCTVYGLSGLIAGIFSRRRRLLFAMTYILVDACAAAVSLGNAAVPAILYETFIASVIFMLLPPSFMARLSILIPGTSGGYGVLKSREYTKSRVEQAALAFRELYETVQTAAGVGRNDQDIASVFDKAAEAACLTCARSSTCWHQDYQTTVDAMNNASPAMLERGSLQESDLPDYFVHACVNLPEFITAVNAELKGLLYRRQFRKRLKENQNAAFHQYGDVAAILNGISEELGSGTSFEPELENRLRKYLRSLNIQAETAVFRDRAGRLHAELFGANTVTLKKIPDYLEKLSAVLNVRLCTAETVSAVDRLYLLEAEPLAASVGISSKKKSEKGQSGDKGAYFKTDEGLLYVILSDGMGTGAEAARYAGDTVRILERFLRSGVAPETAVRMLNDLMLLKNEDDIGCATVDLVCINLFTGDARLFKYGAAPSYLRNGRGVRRMKGKSLAAGLGLPPHDAPDQLKMVLKPGSVAVIVSDGITADPEDGWLCEIISKFSGDTPKDLAASIVRAATEKYGVEDDMTVIAIQMAERV